MCRRSRQDRSNGESASKESRNSERADVADSWRRKSGREGEKGQVNIGTPEISILLSFLSYCRSFKNAREKRKSEARNRN